MKINSVIYVKILSHDCTIIYWQAGWVSGCPSHAGHAGCYARWAAPGGENHTGAQDGRPRMRYLTLDDALTLRSATEDPVGLVRSLDSAVIDEVQRAPELLLATMVRTYQNRFLTNHSVLWSAYHPRTQYSFLSNLVKYVTFEVAAYENEVIDLIASWYLQGNILKVMRTERRRFRRFGNYRLSSLIQFNLKNFYFHFNYEGV